MTDLTPDPLSETALPASACEGLLVSAPSNNKPLFTIRPNGTLEFGPGYEPDAAARVFWDAVQRLAPAAAGVAPAVDQTLRDQMRLALATADGFHFDSLEPHDYQRHVDMLLAVLGDQRAAIRAAALEEGAAAVAEMDTDPNTQYAAEQLRRMAAGAQQQTDTEAPTLTRADVYRELADEAAEWSGVITEQELRRKARMVGKEEQPVPKRPPMDPVHILGIDAAVPAPVAQQPAADGEEETRQATADPHPPCIPDHSVPVHCPGCAAP